jgi:hypothetical protein
MTGLWVRPLLQAPTHYALHKFFYKNKYCSVIYIVLSCSDPAYSHNEIPGFRYAQSRLAPGTDAGWHMDVPRSKFRYVDALGLGKTELLTEHISR